MTVGPVCHVSPETKIGQPQPLAMPSVAVAQPNIASLTATVNQLRQMILIFTGQQGTQGRPGAPGTNGKDANAKGTWSETARTTSKVKIFQNNDESTGVFVEVEQINSLTMGNKDTGQTWKWQRGS